MQGLTQEQKIIMIEGNDCIKREDNYKNLLTVSYAENKSLINSINTTKEDNLILKNSRNLYRNLFFALSALCVLMLLYVKGKSRKGEG